MKAMKAQGKQKGQKKLNASTTKGMKVMKTSTRGTSVSTNLRHTNAMNLLAESLGLKPLKCQVFAAAKKISTVEFKRNINILEAMATGPGIAFEVLKKDAIVFIKPE